MMRFGRFRTTVLLCGIPFLCMAQSDYLIEAEAFQFKGKWVLEKSSECLGSAMLRVYQDNKTAGEEDAVTVIDIKEEGEYAVWTRSRDYNDSQGKRTYQLTIGDNPMSLSGRHGRAGFYWEKVGVAELKSGHNMLRLHDTGMYFGRCDAVLLTKDTGKNPNTLTSTQLARWRVAPVEISSSAEGGSVVANPVEIQSFVTAASASNGNIRISFGKPYQGSDRIVCKVDYYANGSWRRYGGNDEDNRLLVIYNHDGTAYNQNSFFPAWDYCGVNRVIDFDGQTYKVRADGDNTNPYNAGEVTEAVARTVSKPDANTIKVVYDCDERATVTVYWTVPEEGSHIEVRTEMTAKAAGMYSMALQPAKAVDYSETVNVLLAPMFQYRRIPDTPKMMLSGMTQQPVAIVETQAAHGPVSVFVSADLDSFADGWGGYDFSSMGFSLRNNAGRVQPVAFAPVMGMGNSKIYAGECMENRFVMGIVPEAWNGTLEYVSDNVFKVGDYRSQTDVSLTEALFNMTDLMHDDDAGGWNAGMKGFWDIEYDGNVQPTVAQASPLTVVAQAMLAHDEDMYISRALPTIEYTLSRSGYRWTALPGTATVMSPMNSQFTTSYYCGLNEITGGLNPWLADIAIPSGQLRTGGAYGSSVQLWRQALSAYRMTGDSRWLADAVSGADNFMSENIYSGSSEPFTQSNFYNSVMYGPWWLLTDIYEVTGDIRYLQAAQYGSAHTLAGVRSYPRVDKGQMTVHPGNVYTGINTVWWKGSEPYRLGFPRKDGDAPEHNVDVWKVSPVGLGIEQPATYFQRAKGKRSQPVMMSSWAPHLMRLSALTGKNIYNVYARNAVIGRSGNYPGYYATGYTDIPMAADFPYSGPDVSSIYYHHIPAHIAFTEDFLISEAVCRSAGNISFPYGHQEGFVWFTNRVYGNGRGTVFGDNAMLWMKRGLVAVDDVRVNYVTALSDNNFWVILLNESNCSITPVIRLGKEITGNMSSMQAMVYGNDGTCCVATMESGMLKAEVGPMGLTAVAFPLNKPFRDDIQPVTDGMCIIDTGTPAGRIYLYRIRSPFGWDSVYGVAEATNVEGMTIDVECGDKTCEVDGYPYEWTMMKYGYDEDTDLKITVRMNGSVSGTFTTSFAGCMTGIVEKADHENNKYIKGIYNMYGMRMESMSNPGIYVVNGNKILKK